VLSESQQDSHTFSHSVMAAQEKGTALFGMAPSLWGRDVRANGGGGTPVVVKMETPSPSWQSRRRGRWQVGARRGGERTRAPEGGGRAYGLQRGPADGAAFAACRRIAAGYTAPAPGESTALLARFYGCIDIVV
jgi:hypothetical protein